ncbi:uncharacterized protein [Anabrus simplex]
MNGIGGTASRSYREVTRTVQQESLPREYHVTRTVQQEVLPSEYRDIPHDYREVSHRTVQQDTLPRDYQQVVTRTVQQETVPQVQYLSAANPTTVVQERASSPMNPGEQRSVTAYKTVSYQYKSSDKQQSVPIVDSKVITSKSASDERLQQNLTELDSLLVDLHQAQKTGFGSPQGGSTTTTTRTEVVTSGVDPGLLEPVNHSTPAPPARQQQQQHISRSVQYKYNNQQYDSDGPSPVRYQIDTPSPRLQPKRSSSANRELVYGPNEPGHTRTTRSPSPMRQRDVSSLERQHATLHKEMYYENKSNSNVLPSTRSQTMPHEHYREKSPTNERLRRELFYETKTTGSVPPSPRYRDMSPPSQRRGTSPVPPVQTISSSPEPYPGQPGGTSRVTTVRTYNYTTNTAGTPPPPPPVSRSPYPSVSPSPIPMSKSPYPETVTVTELSPSPHRSPPASSPENYPPPHQTLPPGVLPYPPPPQIPGQPPTKVITTVHTYTYEIPGQPGVNHPYPPPGTTTTTYVNSLPPDAPDYPGPGDRTLTYHVSPQLPREKEPLLPQEPPTVIHSVEPPQPPTVITYKYSTHHTSHTSNNNYPGGPAQPEEQQPLLPRPFPTSSPPPGQTSEGQPPKRLDDLMASFGDPKEPASPPSYYTTEKTVTTTTSRHPEGNGVAIVPPSTAITKTKETEKTVVKQREKTVNKPGPPVYYPPGVELFTKNEESMMTQGSKKASASGKYKYESESKSKSSSGGGAAVVPVCLPLCCAMPCVIL